MRRINSVMESPFSSPTFDRDGSFRVDEAVGAMSISPSGRDVVLASRQGLHIIDLDSPYAPPRYIQHETAWEVADVQWSPFAVRDHWVVSTSNQVALVWDLYAMTAENAINHALHGREGHNRAITDINFSAHDPDMVATCGIDSFVLTWDLRQSQRPVQRYADWQAGAQQVKFNRKDPHILASAHNSRLHVWDDRKGATPLYTINAHQTKIYGIDWSRSDSMVILTCSLDKTIKLWNFADKDLKPHRIMRVNYPVWRARHTPFGLGILAMPHRDDNTVHLYDRRTYRISDRDSSVQPMHRFLGHKSNVREFLWRPRGSLEDGRDHRDFQLVTWGSDQQLLLHRVNEEMLSKVGHTKGAAFPDGEINIPRKGAVYHSFHDTKVLSRRIAGQNVAGSVGSLNDRPSSARPAALRREHSDGITPPSSRRGQVDALTWIKGVKIHKFDEVTGQRRPASTEKTGKGIWTEPDELGAEVAWVSERLPEVEIKEPDVKARRCVVAFDAPWTEEGKSCWVKCMIRFPEQYPASRETPDYEFDWPATISEATKTRLTYQLQALLIIYANAGKGSLETALRFLLGQRSFEQSSIVDSLAIELGDTASKDLIASVDDHEDEEEDEALESVGSIAALDMENSGTVGSAAPNISNINVPLPKACGAVFAPNGLLVCFFPSKHSEPLASFAPKQRDAEKTQDVETAKIFEEFNRLNFSPAALASSRRRNSSSSSSDDDTSPVDLHHSSTIEYRKGLPSQFSLRDEHIVARDHQEPEPVGPASYVSLRNLKDILPCSITLAKEYRIVGFGDEVCAHNAAVAAKHGLHEITHTWNQFTYILARSVPLKSTILHDGSEALVEDHRPLDDADRPDSGHAHGENDSALFGKAQLHGRIKWRGHPFGGGNNSTSDRASLIQRTLKRYEDAGDVQMLAMLACILAPVPPSATGSFITRYPTHSPQYYSSTAVANSIKAAGKSPIDKTPSFHRSNPSQPGPTPALLRSGSSVSSSIPSSWSRSLAWLTSSSPQAVTPARVESDEETDSDEDLLPAPNGRVTVRLTNQDYFEGGYTADTPFLLPEDDEKYRSWRSMYADQLQAWGLFTARCEILKFGGTVVPRAPNHVDQYRSALYLRCGSCNEETQQSLPSAEGDATTTTKACHTCSRPLRLPECPVCMEMIRGLSVPCLRCGHVSHVRCLNMWHAEGGEDATMCPAGCGCECFGSSGQGPVDTIDGTEWVWKGVE